MKTIEEEYEYYIYELIDPRTHITFYVGKGKGDRIADHVKKYKRNSKYQSNQNKIAHIESIIKSGNEVIEQVTQRFKTQEEAIDAESDLIGEYGIQNLTNIYLKGVTHKRYSIAGFTGNLRLIISMLARSADIMNKSHPSNHKETSHIITGSEVYVMIVEGFEEYKAKERAGFMRILNNEISKRWNGRALLLRKYR